MGKVFYSLRRTNSFLLELQLRKYYDPGCGPFSLLHCTLDNLDMNDACRLLSTDASCQTMGLN